VRLAIEPTAASFAAVRATAQELESIEQCLDRRRSATRESAAEDLIDQDLEFHAAIVAASHNPMLRQLCEVIRAPFRTALNCMARFASTAQLGLEAHEALLAALRQRNPLAARRAAEDVVGVAMLAVEKAARAEARRTRK
jgi:DNA-binding FadR family transcriptional regulator